MDSTDRSQRERIAQLPKWRAAMTVWKIMLLPILSPEWGIMDSISITGKILAKNL